MGWDVISGRRSLHWKRFWECEVLLNFPISILTGKCGGYIINKSDVTVWWTAVGQFTFFIVSEYYQAISPGRKDFAKKSKLLTIRKTDGKEIWKMTLQQLNYAITIAESGSLNKAAEILYVSQPSLSSALQELEKEVGIQLFYRSGRGVSLTQDGAEFISYARQLYSQYESMMEKYGHASNLKKKFGVSTQHYSFAVKAFVELVKKFDTSRYEFAIRETKTKDVISDVSGMRSEIGILYLSEFNQAAINKLLRAGNLVFHHLFECQTYVYLWSGHPLAKEKEISFEQLKDYPCLSFEQGDASSFYFAEEILSTREYTRTIKACDRATMLNLMIGLNGYTLCSGIICEELNGDDYLAVPFKADSVDESSRMEIGYITRKNTMLSEIGELYIKEIKQYLHLEEE